MKNYQKYKKLYDWKKAKKREWPDNEITHAPIWCSVDLRDGNQALPNPMTLEEKIEFFDYLVKIGFKEIEIGFPAASDTEYNFTRYLIENNKIPDDVTIQVITQARKEIISKTFESLKGAKNAIIHLYNSTSKVQREVVFNKTKEEIKEIALFGARMMNECIKDNKETNWTFEYSPESLSTTELDYALEIINEVINTWKGKTNNKTIINLPTTIECSSPNVFADQVEYIIENITDRKNTIISIHAHNDRGTGVATSEMALLAGADRIEGTLFGNGERTGNADILNIAMNMYTLGINPKLDFSNINETKELYEEFTKMTIGPRHPYAGELVFTAFSGSHQDAISKGLKSQQNNKDYWEVPYLPLDPKDINRQYEPIIRINSQSGKGGITFILEQEYGYEIPKDMKKEIGYFVKDVSDKKHRELTNEEIYYSFIKEYQNKNNKIRLNTYKIEKEKTITKLTAELKINNKVITKTGRGNGTIDALIKILKNSGYTFEFKNYIQQSLKNKNEKSKAITYINIESNGKNIWAIGKASDIVKSSLLGVISSINRI